MAKICQLHADLKYFLCMQPVDMRKQFQGLQGIVNEEFGRYLTQDEAFIFIGKTLKTAKILHRESNGLTCMCVDCRTAGSGCLRGMLIIGHVRLTIKAS